MPYKDPEQRRAYDRERAKHRHRMDARNAWLRKRYAEDAEYREMVKAKSRATPRHVWRAQKAVARELRAGRMVRPTTCERCSAEGWTEAAHSDYERHLDVDWLCRSCHRRQDRLSPKS